VDVSEKRQLQIGAAVLILAIAGVSGMVLFGNVRMTPTIKFHIHFGHMAGLEEGAAVHLAGEQVGEITALRLVPAGTIPDAHPLYPLGGVTADIRMDASFAARAAINGEYFVGSKGVLGARYIEIGPPANDAAAVRPLQQGDEVRGIDPPQLDRALYRALRNLDASRDFLEELAPEATALRDELAVLQDLSTEVLPSADGWDELLADTKASSAEIVALVDGTGDLGNLDRVLVRADKTVERAASEFELVRMGLFTVRDELRRVSHIVPPDLRAKLTRVQMRLEHNLETLDGAIARARDLVATIERAEGAIGAIMNDPEFSDDARDLGKLMKREPWKVFGHPGNKRPKFGRPPEAPDM